MSRAAKTGAPAGRPHVTCHMMGSLDGRLDSKDWGFKNPGKFFEGPASKIHVDAWIVGRTTMQEFASKRRHRKRSGRFAVPPGDFVGAHEAKTFAVAIDPAGKCRWDSNMVSTEHVIEVLAEGVSAEYLDHLRAENVSYIFAGKRRLDLALALEKLRKLFGIRRVRVDGGGHVNGSFLEAGLIDEFSYVLMPVADGRSGSLTIFERGERGARRRPGTRFRLKSVKRLPKGALWIRYARRNSNAKK